MGFILGVVFNILFYFAFKSVYMKLISANIKMQCVLSACSTSTDTNTFCSSVANLNLAITSFSVMKISITLYTQL